MKKNKAFTLIELLAVIVILGILSILIVPKVMTSINESEEKTNMSSAENLLSTAIYKVTNNDIQGSNQSITINYTTGENTDYLEYSGKKPLTGKILIKSNGQIAMAVQIGNYCYKKEPNENEITSIRYNKDTCITRIPEIVTSGDGLYESTTEPGRLIYRGENPNNYIILKENNEDILYRIVSFEEDGTIKVVRDEKIGAKSYDVAKARYSDGINNTYCTSQYGCNVWGSGTTTLYNGFPLGDNFHYVYYTSANATTLINSSSGTVIGESTLNQYLNSKIANSTSSWQPAIQLDKYIDNHTWNVGGVYYIEEEKGILKEKEEERQLKWIGKIALLNITEYVEASLNAACTNVKGNIAIIYRGNGPVCKELNWVFKPYNQWTLSSSTSQEWRVWSIDLSGCSSIDNVPDTYGVRPAFYLKSTLQLAGQGTVEHPYYIVES